MRIAALCVLIATGCGEQRSTATPAPADEGFASPQRVAIRGYAGDAMEPFITRDGRYLFFNNRNDPRVDTDLHYAERVDDLTFDYRGELKGANSPALDGVASMDRDGNLFFISTRSYAQTQATLYRGRFRAGRVNGVELVPGVSQAGWVTGDVRLVESRAAKWLQIVSVAAAGDAVEVRLANATRATRVHVVATRFVPARRRFTI